VYYGNLTPQIRAVKVFSLLSSVAGLASQPILVHEMPNLGTPAVVALFGFVGFFTFVTPFLLHMITKKYVTHIYFNSDTEMYSAVCLNFFLREKMVIKLT
jgi:transmembrane protein 70